MKKLFTLLCMTSFLYCTANNDSTSCTPVKSIIINTGNTFPFAQPNGQVLLSNQQDTLWTVSEVSPLIQSYFGTLPSNSFVVDEPAVWNTTDSNISRWIVPTSVGYFTTSASNPPNTAWVEFSREFTVSAAEDNLEFDFKMVNDDHVIEIAIDNTPITITGIPQPTNYPSTQYYQNFKTFNFSANLSQGNHTLSVKVVNYNTESNFGNFCGINVIGTISSVNDFNSLKSQLPGC